MSFSKAAYKRQQNTVLQLVCVCCQHERKCEARNGSVFFSLYSCDLCHVIYAFMCDLKVKKSGVLLSYLILIFITTCICSVHHVTAKDVVCIRQSRDFLVCVKLNSCLEPGPPSHCLTLWSEYPNAFAASQ